MLYSNKHSVNVNATWPSMWTYVLNILIMQICIKVNQTKQNDNKVQIACIPTIEEFYFPYFEA